MKKNKYATALAALALTLAACQSNTFKILGKAKGLQEGDTLIMTTDFYQGTPANLLVVKDGKFDIEGQTDSVYLCMVYQKGHPEINGVFFVEPGTIHLEISDEPNASRVSGTPTNNSWQLMSDSVNTLASELQVLAEKVYTPDVIPDRQLEAQAQMEVLNKRIMDVIARTTERNIDNELGYFILTNYLDEDIFTNQKRRELIAKMPAKLRQRQPIKDMEQLLAAAESTEKGSTIDDFSLPTPEGIQLSILAEAAKNKVTILDFWASWCGPCRQVMPQVKELYAKYHDKGLGIVGISLDSDETAWLAAIKEEGLAWPQVSDLKGWESSAALMFQVRAIPHMVLLDSKGVVLERGLRGDKLEDFIAQKLKE